MDFKNPFKDLSRFELTLWISSLITVSGAFIISGLGNYLTLLSSLIGVTALIFVAKGYVLGQLLTVIFALFYGFISLHLKYYGEMITYLGMTAPMAIFATISWIRHPYQQTAEVEVKRLNKFQIIIMLIATAVVTFAFYFILKALGTASLLLSTISVATSFIASYLTFMRSSFYGLGYGANDIVLIILWTIASVEDISYIPMVICFVMFFINYCYGFFNWQKIEKRQKA